MEHSSWQRDIYKERNGWTIWTYMKYLDIWRIIIDIAIICLQWGSSCLSPASPVNCVTPCPVFLILVSVEYKYFPTSISFCNIWHVWLLLTLFWMWREKTLVQDLPILSDHSKNPLSRLDKNVGFWLVDDPLIQHPCYRLVVT